MVVTLIAFVLTGILDTAIVYAQTYPSKPLRIVTYPAGGGQDFAARLIAQGLTATAGWTVIVDNRAGGVVPGEVVAKSPPDGYTLLLAGGSLWLAPFLQDNVPYDPVRDFAPITLATSAPNILVVHPSMPVKSVKELIAIAKARPGELNYASGPTGGANHIAAELFKVMAGVNMVRVAYKGGAPALSSVLGGETQLMFAPAAAATPYLKSGRLRALAVTSGSPSALAPGLPTVAANRLPGYEIVGVDVMFAPAKTAAAIISRLNQEIVRVLNQPDVKEKFLSTGVEALGTSPEELANKMKSEMATLGKVIRNFN